MRPHKGYSWRKHACTDRSSWFFNPPPPQWHSIELENDDGQQKQPDLPEEDVLNPSDGETPVGNVDREETSASHEGIRAALKIGAVNYRVITRKEDLKGIDATRARRSLLRGWALSMKESRETNRTEC